MKLTDTITQVTHKELAAALRAEFPFMSSEGVLLLLAHTAFETGRFQSCHCFNLGNAKASDKWAGDHTFFSCGEEVKLSVATAEQAKFPTLITFKDSPYQRKEPSGQLVWYQSVKVFPEHPWCRFRAFKSLQEGARDHLSLLQWSRYAKAWEAVAPGDTKAFARELYAAGYYNGSPDTYRKGLMKEFAFARGLFLGRPKLDLGSKGPDVAWWQKNALNFTGNDVTGVYDQKTKEATRNKQAFWGLDSDGVVGNISWAYAMPAYEVNL